MQIINNILDLLFPLRCPVCDEILPYHGKSICNDCKRKIVYIKEPYCLKCGKKLIEDKEYCADCNRRPHKFEQGTAIFDYSSIAGSVYRFKNMGKAEYARFYAEEIYKHKRDWINAVRPDAFVPVPIHSHKLRRRGYNQSELLSLELSKITGIPTLNRLIIRTKNTKPLKDLSLRQRQNNLEKAFKVSKNVVKLKTIMIIDDIYTTGSTIDEICNEILSITNCRIYFLTLTIGRGI